MPAVYQPKPGTLAAQALNFIERSLDAQPKGSWIANTDVCQALSVRPNAIVPTLGPAVNAGLVERSLNQGGFTQWRLCVIKPRRKTRAEAAPSHPTFSIPNWPPGFVSRFESVSVPSYETRRK